MGVSLAACAQNSGHTAYGGIIGGLAWEAGKTYLYLSGTQGVRAAEYLSSVGMPDGLNRAAGEIYHRMAQFNKAPMAPALKDVLEALIAVGKDRG